MRVGMVAKMKKEAFVSLVAYSIFLYFKHENSWNHIFWFLSNSSSVQSHYLDIWMQFDIDWNSVISVSIINNKGAFFYIEMEFYHI